MNQHTKHIHLLLCSALVSLFLLIGRSLMDGSAAAAQEENGERQQNRLIGIEAGELQVDPYLRQEVRYDSNIFRKDSDEEDDIISDTMPGVNLAYDRENVRLNASFETVLHRNADVEDADDDVDLNGSLGGRVDIGESFFASAGTSYNETNSALEHPFADLLTVFNREHTGTVGYDDGTFHAEATYTYQSYQVDEVFDGLDYKQWTGSSLVSYRYTDSIQFRLRGVYGKQDFDDGPDALINEYTGGILWTPRQSFGLVVDAGYREDRFEGDGSDYESPVVRVTGSWIPLETTTVNLQLSHASADSALTNYVVRDRAGIDATYDPRGDWSFSSRLSYTVKQEAEDAVPQDRKGLFNGGVSTTWSGLTHFTDFTLGYDYREKVTDDGVSEYEAHIVTLSGVARF